jgi:hypothetical protein
MIEKRDEEITQFFTRAEMELTDEDFRTRVMLQIARRRRRDSVLRYGSWALLLLCSCFIVPTAVKVSFYAGNAIGNLPVLLANSLQPYLNFPMVLLVLSAIISYLLARFRLLKLPSLHIFGRFGIFRIYR